MSNPPRADAAGNLLAELERLVADLGPPAIATLLGDLERLKVLLWQHLLDATARLSASTTHKPTDPLDDLRHLTPHQVAERLNLKLAYVHELCRTGRLPAIKQGKYWLIPTAGLRRSLPYQNGHVDSGVDASLHSRDDRQRTVANPGRAPIARATAQRPTRPRRESRRLVSSDP